MLDPTTDSPDPLVTALGGRSIVLVGMMGAGKTSVGKRLAQRLRLRRAAAGRPRRLARQARQRRLLLLPR